MSSREESADQNSMKIPSQKDCSLRRPLKDPQRSNLPFYTPQYHKVQSARRVSTPRIPFSKECQAEDKLTSEPVRIGMYYIQEHSRKILLFQIHYLLCLSKHIRNKHKDSNYGDKPNAFHLGILRDFYLQEVTDRNAHHLGEVSDFIKKTRGGPLEYAVFLVFDEFPVTLSTVMKSRQNLIERHYKYIVYQLLSGLHNLHRAGVIVQMLQPSNIFINGESNVSICQILPVFPSIEPARCNNTVFNSYQAPEVIAKCTNITEKADVYSVGIILYSFVISMTFLGDDSRNRFLHGYEKENIAFFNHINNLLSPTADEYNALLSTSREHASIAVLTADDLPPKSTCSVDSLFSLHSSKYSFANSTCQASATDSEAKDYSVDVIVDMEESCIFSDGMKDFLRSIIQFSPECRLSILEAMNHPWLREMRENIGHDPPLEEIPDTSHETAFFREFNMTYQTWTAEEYYNAFRAHERYFETRAETQLANMFKTKW